MDCFCDDGGSHSIRVTGKEQVASAMALYSRPYGVVPGVWLSCGEIWVSRMRIWPGCQRCQCIHFLTIRTKLWLSSR